MVEGRLHVVLDAPPAERLVRAEWRDATLQLSAATALPFAGPILSTANDEEYPQGPVWLYAQAGGTQVFTESKLAFSSTAPIAGLSTGGDRVHVRAADGKVHAFTGTGEKVASLRMPPAAVHGQLTLPHVWFIIE